MKVIPNTTYVLIEGSPTTTAKMLMACLENPPQQGFDFATIRARQRVAAAIDKIEPGSEITLEDADFSTAVEAVRVMRWALFHKDVIAFAELFGL